MNPLSRSGSEPCRKVGALQGFVARDNRAVDRVREAVLGIVVPSDGQYLTTTRQFGQDIVERGHPPRRLDGHAPLTDLQDTHGASPVPSAGFDGELGGLVHEPSETRFLAVILSAAETAHHLRRVEPAEEGYGEDRTQQTVTAVEPSEWGQRVGSRHSAP